MTGGSTVRFAIISDPHAVGDTTQRHDTYAYLRTATDPEANPFAAVRRLIERSREDGEEPLAADALLCPGDLTNRMDRRGLRYAWKELGEIAELLGTDRVVATAGNHDIARMPEGADDEAWVAALCELVPQFPCAEQDHRERYFTDDFMVVEGERWRVVTLNSCARHAEAGEARRGKIDQKTLWHLQQKIDRSRKEINILMCHHHPVEWTHLARKDTSYMDGGEQLLRELEADDPARWIVLHGHRHVPALGYSGETSSGPVRLSAGSLAVCLEEQGRGYATNQFYMLEFHLAEIARLDLVGAGRFRAWNWMPVQGMTVANQSSELPGRGGFGFRRDSHELARMCRERAAALSQRSVTWQELVEGDPRWSYVCPRDLSMMRRTLELQNVLVEPRERGAEIESVSFRGAESVA
jgi:predicted phosphodiesterase